MATVLHVVAARPNFVKMAPVIEAVGMLSGVGQLVVHTGQHYDQRMSDEMISDLGLPEPDVFLGIGSGRHGEQTGRTLIAFEEVLVEHEPDLVVVAGDVNSTLACALAAAKLGIQVAHVESGLRSGDWEMPEEINRVLTDRLSDLLFTHSPEATDNLAGEGIDVGRVRYVGNTMIDSLLRYEQVARERAGWQALGLDAGSYLLITLHRPSNVDDPARLEAIVDALARRGAELPMVFPVHPRTRARMVETGQVERLESAGVKLLEPLGYLDFLSLETGAGAVLTDSGGIQEETSALGVRCYTLRANTERPITIAAGTNELIGDDPRAIDAISIGPPARSGTIPLWDGRSGERVAEAIEAALHSSVAETAA
jgi:UDP-N-acetylglucosamine 2-epimerase (non-hydrolysing)